MSYSAVKLASKAVMIRLKPELTFTLTDFKANLNPTKSNVNYVNVYSVMLRLALNV